MTNDLNDHAPISFYLAQIPHISRILVVLFWWFVENVVPLWPLLKRNQVKSIFMKEKLLSLFALLLMIVTGAWAEDMKTVPLTLEAKTAGTIVVSSPKVGMQYSLNGGGKAAVTSEPIDVAAGQTVAFYGSGTSITSYFGTKITGGTADCYIYGNIMSLVDETGFATATTLTGSANFSQLFQGNTHLYNHASKDLVLPATTLTSACYGSMFQGCTNLTTAPALPATTLANNCYELMFNGCTNLTAAPVLPATTLAEYCYDGMFQGCTKLNSVTCFATNISATNATKNWLKDVAATGTFSMAEGMTGWTPESPDGIPSGWTDKISMKTVPLTLEAMTAGTIKIVSAKVGMKYKKNNGAIVTVSDKETIDIPVVANDKVAFYGDGTNITSYYYTGAGDTQITGGTADCYIYGNIMSLVDETGFATATTLTGEKAFNGFFYQNSKLYNHPSNELVLPATTLTTNCYEHMFSGCTGLTSAPVLPATTLANYCYKDMFNGCAGLTSAPELPATTLTTNCYNGMFRNCTSLNSVTCLATNISAPDATTNWLNGVAALGTFTKATSTDWGPRGVSTIPSGWAIVNNDPITLTDGDEPSSLTPCAGQVCTVNYTRTFTADKPSTVCLPFDYAVKTGEKFYEFTGITQDGDEYVATMTLYLGAKLVANTPYLYKSATTGATDFSDTYAIPASITAGTTTSGDWKFVGTYTTQTWDAAPKGIYGFSAKDATGGISQGEFVKVGAYVRVKPMRCYLMYKNGAEDYPAARGFSDVPNTLSEPLPEKIKVRFIDANGEVTGIGSLNTQTGEVSFDSKTWYTLDGVRLNAQPTQKGIYVNNGKKVVVK